LDFELWAAPKKALKSLSDTLFPEEQHICNFTKRHNFFIETVILYQWISVSYCSDGRLQTNDQIMAVDGVSVVGASHHSVVQLMARSATIGRVNLTIRRPIYESVAQPEDVGVVGSPEHSPASVPIEVTLRRQASEGFGFVIISSAVKAGATIGKEKKIDSSLSNKNVLEQD